MGGTRERKEERGAARHIIHDIGKAPDRGIVAYVLQLRSGLRRLEKDDEHAKGRSRGARPMGLRPRMRGRDGSCAGIGWRARKATGQGASSCSKTALRLFCGSSRPTLLWPDVRDTGLLLARRPFSAGGLAGESLEPISGEDSRHRARVVEPWTC